MRCFAALLIIFLGGILLNASAQDGGRPAKLPSTTVDGYAAEKYFDFHASGSIALGGTCKDSLPGINIVTERLSTRPAVLTNTWSPNVPHDKIVARAIEVRGLKVNVSAIPIPVACGPAFEGERVRGDDIYLEAGGGRSPMVEWVTSKRMNEIEDGKIEIIGPEITDVLARSILPLAIKVEIAGRHFETDYEPILERQIHHLINYAQGVMHIGQRDIAWLRVSKQAVEKGFRLKHIGIILHAKLHQDFGRIFDKLQVTIYTDEAKVKQIVEQARAAYAERDARIEGMTDKYRHLLFLPALPVICAQPCLHHQP